MHGLVAVMVFVDKPFYKWGNVCGGKFTTNCNENMRFKMCDSIAVEMLLKYSSNYPIPCTTYQNRVFSASVVLHNIKIDFMQSPISFVSHANQLNGESDWVNYICLVT